MNLTEVHVNFEKGFRVQVLSLSLSLSLSLQILQQRLNANSLGFKTKTNSFHRVKNKD